MNKQMIIDTLAGGKMQFLGTFNAVPDDKLTWKPLDLGRTVLDLAGDAAQTPQVTAQVLQIQPGAPIPPMGQLMAQMVAERAKWSRADVIEHLESGHAALVKVIEGLSDEDLERPLSIPMRGDFSLTLPIARWALLPYRSYVSRFGQINYIQTLYGDMDGH